MSKRRAAALVAVSLVVTTLCTLAWAGIFRQRIVPHLPYETSVLRTIPAYELDRELSTSPQSIEKVTVFKGLRTVIASIEPLGPAVVDYNDTPELMRRLRAAHVAVQVTDPLEGTVAERFVNSFHPSFWLLLGLSLMVTTWLLVGERLFKKINISLPGLEFGNKSGSELTTPKAEDRRTFDDVAGCDEAIAKLRRVAKWLKSPDWYEQFGAKIPKGILAVGPPGTGKTLLARALAGEVDASFFSAHGSSFVEMFAGVGARRVRKLFAAAVAAHKKTGKPSIIFIDEIDAIGKKRGQSSSGADSERDQTLNQLLVCMQGFEPSAGIIVMAATNMADSLDDALKRPGRFDYQVSVDLPDTLGREKIFGIHTKGMKIAPNVRLKDLAIRTPQFSGADIEQACNEAAICAAERTEPFVEGKNAEEKAAFDMTITLSDFDHGIDYVQFGDPMLSRARAMSEEDRRNTAFHEAGHCAVQQFLQGKGADPITKVTIEPRTKSLGSMQSHSVGDRYGYTEEQLMCRIMTAMGGRCAQEVFLNKKDTGASNDFEQATNLARLMVTEFGMSKLEPFNVKLSNDVRGTRIGTELSNEIDEEWRRIVHECYTKAKDIIVAHRLQIERVAAALLIEQTLLAERFIELWEKDANTTTATATTTGSRLVGALQECVIEVVEREETERSEIESR